MFVVFSKVSINLDLVTHVASEENGMHSRVHFATGETLLLSAPYAAVTKHINTSCALQKKAESDKSVFEQVFGGKW